MQGKPIVERALVQAPTVVSTAQTLKSRLAEWTDWDVAGYHLGAALGMLPEWPDNDVWPADKKWIFWSSNPTGDVLSEMLRSMVRLGFLELDEEEHRLRYNQHFDCTLP